MAEHGGTLRFCDETCHDGYREDQRHGLFTLTRDFADQGYCLYCGSYVPANNEPMEVAA